MHDFSNNDVLVSGMKLDEETGDTFAEIGIGYSLFINKNAYLYGETSYQREINCNPPIFHSI